MIFQKKRLSFITFFFGIISICCAQKKYVKIIEAKKEIIYPGVSGPGPLNSYSFKLLVLKNEVVFDSVSVNKMPLIFKIQKKGKITSQPYSSHINDTLTIRCSAKVSDSTEEALIKYHFKNKKQVLTVKNIKIIKKNFLP